MDVLGHVNDVKPLYEEADIFIYCSWLEGLPNVLLEAMSFGLPILINRYRPFLDVLEEDVQANYFGLARSEEFGRRLCSLLRDNVLRKKMGKRNIEIISEKYGEEAVGKQCLRMLGNTYMAFSQKCGNFDAETGSVL